MQWLIGLQLLGLGLNIAGGIGERGRAQEEAAARRELAQTQIELNLLQEEQAIEQLEKQRDVTVSRQQARTGRGGLTAEGSPLLIEQSILETFGTRGDIDKSTTTVSPVAGSADVVLDFTAGAPGDREIPEPAESRPGIGAIGSVQEQARLQRRAIQQGADIASLQVPSRADLGLDILATTLDAATNIWAFNYQFNQTQIPRSQYGSTFDLEAYQAAWEVF